MPPLKDLTGSTFNGMKVLGLTQTRRNGKAEWRCECHCGKVFSASGDHLTRKASPIKSCGCQHHKAGARHHQWLGAGEISGNWWYNHVLRERKQKVREKVPVTLKVQEAWELFQEQNGTCALSGVPLLFSTDHSMNTASLDRIDSSKGYEPGNVQWVHKHLNFMKRTYSQDYFIEMCGSVYLKHRGHNG